MSVREELTRAVLTPAQVEGPLRDYANATRPELNKLVHMDIVTGPVGNSRAALYSEFTIAEVGAVQGLKAWQASHGLTFDLAEAMKVARPAFLRPYEGGPESNPLAAWIHFMANFKDHAARVETGPGTGYWKAATPPDFWKVDMLLTAYTAFHRLMCGLRFDSMHHIESLLTTGENPALLAVVARPVSGGKKPERKPFLGYTFNPVTSERGRDIILEARQQEVPYRVYSDELDNLLKEAD